jgi:hypothetical protein
MYIHFSESFKISSISIRKGVVLLYVQYSTYVRDTFLVKSLQRQSLVRFSGTIFWCSGYVSIEIFSGTKFGTLVPVPGYRYLPG